MSDNTGCKALFPRRGNFEFPQDFRHICALFPPNFRAAEILNFRSISAAFAQYFCSAEI
jgi:hypothetical protein